MTKNQTESSNLNSAKKFVRKLIRTINEPILILNEDLEVLSANKSFRKYFENTEDTQASSFLDNEPDFAVVSELREILKAELGEQEEIRDYKIGLQLKNGKESVFLLNASYLPWEEDKTSLILVSLKENSVPIYSQDLKTSSFQKEIQDILANAPAMICLLRGPEHIFEIANQNYMQLIGFRDYLGKRVREVLPEVENQGFIQILDNVYRSGKPYIGKELPIKLFTENGEMKNSFLDFVYQPTLDANGKIDGIFVHAVDVTEKVWTRKKLEENETRLKKLIDTVPAIIWIGDKEGRSTYLNKNWYDYTGQTESEAKGLGWMEVVHPDDREETERICSTAVKEEKSFTITFRIKNKNGNYKWAVNQGRSNYNTNGEYEGLIGTVVDVHEEKVKEQLIREKEHRTRAIVEEATVPTAVYIGEEMRIELANDAMISVWGKKRSVIGKPLREALPELEGQPFHDLLKDVYRTGKIYWGKEDQVDFMINGNLQTGFFNFTYKPLRNEKGEIYGILNMALDVTEMVESKNLLAASELYFKQMADLMPNKVTNTDPEGNFIYFNQNWIDYTGLDSNTLKGLGWAEFVHPLDKKEFERQWQESLKTGTDFEMELRYLNKTEKYKWHLSRAEAVKDDNGRIKMWIITNTEIHKIKEEEKRKEEFLKMVSHELKTPITSIKGYIQLLLSQLQKQPEFSSTTFPIKPSLERIEHQVKRLTRLIAEMLDLSRIEENKLGLKKEVFCLNDLVQETVQDIHYTNTQHKIEVINDFKSKVYADKDRIGQVLINFITNAMKYSPESQKVVVKIQKERNQNVSVSVIDEGIGIDKKNHQNIFKRFHRIGGKSEETYSGFGIGLFLAKEIIERHGGKISLKSKKGKGSEFKFSLSVAPEKK